MLLFFLASLTGHSQKPSGVAASRTDARDDVRHVSVQSSLDPVALSGMNSVHSPAGPKSVAGTDVRVADHPDLADPLKAAEGHVRISSEVRSEQYAIRTFSGSDPGNPASPVKREVAREQAAPNLDLSSGSANLTIDGTTISVALTVINNGSAIAAASELGYYLSPDVSYPTTPNYLIGTDSVSTLAVGGASAETMLVNAATSSIPCGTYYVIFVIDHLEQVAESNESDNVWYFPSPKVTIPCKPNLDLVSGTTSITVNGTNVSISATVTNNGSTSAAASELGYYLSPDASLATAPNYLIGTNPVASLEIGGTSPATFTKDVLTVSPAIPAGSYYVFFFFDHLDQVLESNEPDNIWYFSSPMVTVPIRTLATAPSNRLVSCIRGSTSFVITSNCPWTAGSNHAWCIISPSSGMGNGVLSAVYSTNTTGSTRAANVTVVGPGCGSVTVTVTQQPGCSQVVLPLTIR